MGEAEGAAISAALPPGLAAWRGKSVDEVWAELKQSPLFMTELDGDNAGVAALQALRDEGSALEQAAERRASGNECFRAGRLPDARRYYADAIELLLAGGAVEGLGEGARDKGDEAVEREMDRDSDRGKDGNEAEETTTGKDSNEAKDTTTDNNNNNNNNEAGARKTLLEALYVNRAACQLALANYRSCWLDCAAALRLNPANVKACYRAARALLAVDRLEEADDAAARGLVLDPGNAALAAVAADVARRAGQLDARRRDEAAAAARRLHRARLLRAALIARNIPTSVSAKPPELDDAAIQLVPDPDDPRSSLVFPTLLLYPLQLESDLIKAFGEADSLADHLSYILPPPWDHDGLYRPDTVLCFLETIKGGLVKMGRRVPLLRLLSSGNILLVDQLVRIFVLPASKADEWVAQHKAQRAAQDPTLGPG